MSGHSKWSTIKRKKAVIDAKRGKVFTKLINEIMIAARMGGADPDSNPRLRSSIQTAKGSNLPNEKIDRAIARGAGDLEGVTYDEVTYEGYGSGGVAILVDALTDNLNRTVAEVRSAFNNLREFMFQRVYIPEDRGLQGRTARKIIRLLAHQQGSQ